MEKSSFERHDTNFSSVQQIHIHSEKSIINCPYSFPNAKELCFTCGLSITCPKLANLLNRIAPLTKLTKMVFQYPAPPVEKILDLLDYTPQLHTLVFQSVHWLTRKHLLVEQSEKFRRIVKTNVIAHIIYNDVCRLDEAKFLLGLCPRIQHFSLSLDHTSGESVIRFLLDRTNPNTCHLCVICIRGFGKSWYERLDPLLKSERLLDDYTLKLTDDSGLYLWW